MRKISAEVVWQRPMSLSRAAKLVSRFSAVENGSSAAVTMYLERTSEAFNRLVQFHRKRSKMDHLEENPDSPRGRIPPIDSETGYKRNPRKVVYGDEVVEIALKNEPEQEQEQKQPKEKKNKKRKNKEVESSRKKRKIEGVRLLPRRLSPVTITESSQASDINHLTRNGYREAVEFYPFVPGLPEPRIDSDSGFRMIPLLAVQITLFPDSSICIGLGNHHVIGDARSTVGFIRY